MAQFKSLADRQSDRAKALEHKAELARQFAARSSAPKRPIEVKAACEAVTTELPIRQPLAVQRHYGAAAVPMYLGDDGTARAPAPALQTLVDYYLHAAEHRTRHILMLWPTSPHNLALVHSLATLERWARGDKQGVRGMVFPVKTNVFFPLNHIHLERSAVLRHARALLETHPNPAVTRPFAGKDAYLTSLADKAIESCDLHPTVGELLPQFYAAPGFRQWSPCSDKLLSHIGAKLTRRTHAKALRTNCTVIGSPGSAPDALFALDGRVPEVEQRRALEALKKLGAPEVVMVLATRAIRLEAKGWRGALARFCLLLEKVFGPKPPGVIVVTDEPHAAYRLKDELWTLDKKREKGVAWKTPFEYAIAGVPCCVQTEGLLPAGADDKTHPMPREFDVHVVDAEAAKVIDKLQRIASTMPGGRDGAKPIMDAVWYLARLAALPCGVAQLTDYLATPDISDRTRLLFDWPSHMGAVNDFIKSGAVGEHRQELLDCLDRGSSLFTKYQDATPFAHRLAGLVSAATTGKSHRIAVIFPTAFYRLLAERFLSNYRQFPGTVDFSTFKDRVHLVVAGNLDDCLTKLAGATLVFAGLTEECLRLIISDDRIPAHSKILLTQRAGQFLRATLKPIAETFPEFKRFKPRIESILRQLVSLPDHASVLSTSDFVLPTFRVQLNSEFGNDAEGQDPDAWRIQLDNGHVQYRKDTHKVYVYDPSSDLATDHGFRPCEVKSLEVGDKLFTMSGELRELVEQTLTDAGVPIHSDRTFEGALRAYHAQVKAKLAERFPGNSRRDQVRALRAAMIAVNPKLESELPGEQAMTHWVNLGSSPDTPFEQLRPQAPAREPNFQAFAQALGFSPLEAAYQWQRVVMAVRNSRRLDGRHVSDIYAYMLLQPESAMVHSNIKREKLKRLFDKARDSVATVEAIGPRKEAAL